MSETAGLVLEDVTIFMHFAQVNKLLNTLRKFTLFVKNQERYPSGGAYT